jgi:hypothetical protein
LTFLNNSDRRRATTTFAFDSVAVTGCCTTTCSLQKYLQTHPDAFQRFELMRPVLQVWHTQWTNLSQIFKTHLGEPLNNNPATITWSSKEIGWALPSNPKKVDYYPEMELLVLLHDTQMLDCWRLVAILI